jgi:glycerol-3-phosphate dehydrogenase (NAD(P)+)
VKSLAIIGGGSWGTALAIILAPRFPRVRLWVYEADLAARMRETRENDVYLPGCRLPRHVEVLNQLPAALDGAEIVLSAVPSHLVRGLYQQMLPCLHESMVFVSATKGLENGTLATNVGSNSRGSTGVYGASRGGDLRSHLCS